MKRFALIGAAGYIAPKHMQAIKDVGGDLVAALDPFDSVGVLDRYFPKCHFFTEFERFDRHLELLRRQGEGVDYVSVCSPNYLHDAHCRFALRIGADAICEKPVVTHIKNIDGLKELEEETGRKIWCVLQLRHHPLIQSMDKGLSMESPVVVYYFTPRGNWYLYSWKGQDAKTGGLTMNIGIHIFDLLSHLFGKMVSLEASVNTDRYSIGRLVLGNVPVHFYLSIAPDLEPFRRILQPDTDFRIDLSGGFTELHTEVYKAILEGKGFGLEDAREGVRICQSIREGGLITQDFKECN